MVTLNTREITSMWGCFKVVNAEAESPLGNWYNTVEISTQIQKGKMVYSFPDGSELVVKTGTGDDPK